MRVGPQPLFVILIVCLPAAPVAISRAAARPAIHSEKRPPWEQDARFRRLRKWLDAVEQHEPGTMDAPAIAIGALSRTELQALSRDVKALFDAVRLKHEIGEPASEAGIPPTRDTVSDHPARPLAVLLGLANRATALHAIRRGALLHADVAMLVPAERGRVEGPIPADTSRVLFWVSDGRNDGFEPSPLHWDLARTLLDQVTAAPSSDEMVRLWYVATAAHMHTQGRLGDLTSHLERAQQLFPSDADVWFYRGCLHETQAAPRIQAALRSTTIPLGFTVSARATGEELRLAEAHFRRTLEIAPGHTESRVRLARVAGTLGRHEEAAADLKRAIAGSGNRRLLYFAHLFLGREEQALGHHDAAGAAFEQAAALFPEAQSPRLALSQLTWRSGDRSGALESMSSLWTLPSDENARADPWWQYYATHVVEAETLLAELRRPFLRVR
jgi:tetratricopeptide (TPR) repeat protein